MVAILLTWISCQLVEIVLEKLERNRITRRFSTYVDPALVNYVIEHPDEKVTEGQEREMTVVFTDLAGFTTISETLKEKVIPLLNEYLGLMSSIIKKHNGLVNKFLGDGIMFFFNAPRPNPRHAIDAVETVLEMQQELIGFNEGLLKRGLPAITMRAGITTGSMVVGDAGGMGRSDYTVIGDNVNLAARLESANKATDTKVMMTARTCELLNGQFLVRPTARLQVKGKTEGVDTCELIARSDQATDAQRRQAELGKAVFDAFVKSDFAGCLNAVEKLEAEFGKTKLTKAYHELSEEYLKQPPGEGFDGQIVLHEK
jgi:adenylate cyclase